MSDHFLIRDVFNTTNVFQLGEDIKRIYSDFDLINYKIRLSPYLGEATFSERKTAISKCLTELLPDNIDSVISILLPCLPPPYSKDSLEGDMDRFIVAPMAEVVTKVGINHFDASMEALYEMTKSFSAEWAIRPFIEKYPEKSQDLLLTWTRDNNAHVRRLVSEGTRPYLPWGKKLSVTERTPNWSLPLLEKLINDPSKYVQTSVANHLNDLTRKHPEQVLSALKRWKKPITNHKPIPFFKKALRNLIKAGNSRALELIGYSPDVKVEVDIIECTEQVTMGERMVFQCAIKSNSSETQDVLVDFIIHFQKSNGSISPKVFKLTSFTLTGNETRTIAKSFSFKPITTRKYYSGPHKLEIMVNGKVKARKSFKLITP